MHRLLEECCDMDPKKRPEFQDIILRLEYLKDSCLKRHWYRWSRPKPVVREIMMRLTNSDCYTWAKKKPGSVSNVDDSVPALPAPKSPRAIRAWKPINEE